MSPNIDEALRYLGVHQADDALRTTMTALADELSARITPRFTWRAFNTTSNSEFIIHNSSLVKSLLAECHHAAVLVATLGAEFDLWMRQLSARDLSRAVMLDALGSAYVESACDAAEDAVRARFPDMFLTDRFSPGYGDFPLEAQRPLTEFAGASRIGVTVTDSLLLLPQKSVTAIVGIAPSPQPARIRGCGFCSLRHSCPYRKAGQPCHV